MLTAKVRAFDPTWAKNADALRRVHARLLDRLEQSSRGMTGDVFPAGSGVKSLLVSGFDPFGFPQGPLEQGNPSGAAVLALDGTTLTASARAGATLGCKGPIRAETEVEDLPRGAARERPSSAVVHLHVPVEPAPVRNGLIAKIRQILEAALPHL